MVKIFDNCSQLTFDDFLGEVLKYLKDGMDCPLVLEETSASFLQQKYTRSDTAYKGGLSPCQMKHITSIHLLVVTVQQIYLTNNLHATPHYQLVCHSDTVRFVERIYDKKIPLHIYTIGTSHTDSLNYLQVWNNGTDEWTHEIHRAFQELDWDWQHEHGKIGSIQRGNSVVSCGYTGQSYKKGDKTNITAKPLATQATTAEKVMSTSKLSGRLMVLISPEEEVFNDPVCNKQFSYVLCQMHGLPEINVLEGYTQALTLNWERMLS